MRKRLWQIHSWLGLVAGLGLLVIGLTGSLLVFHDELEAAFNPSVVRVDGHGADRFTPDALLAAANAALPAGHEVAGWLYRHDEPDQADLLYIRKHGESVWLIATVNPFTGEMLASPRAGTATLTGWLLELHYEFFAGDAGLWIVGGFGVLLLALGVSGVWLYREFWKHLLTLRWRRGLRILFSDIHKFVGIASVAFNLVLGFTGAYWNLTHAVGHLLEEEHADDHAAPARRLYPDSLDLDTLTADTASRIAGYRANYVSLPFEEGQPVRFFGAVPGNPLASPYGSIVMYDAWTGNFISAHDLSQAGFWRRLVDAFVPLHYGTFGGLPVKILWSIGGLTPGILAISGFAIWLQRRRKPARPVA